MNKYLLNMPENLQMNPRMLADFYQRIFGEKMGTFVEIGAFDGWSWSHTWTLACLGWKGYYVEPLQEHADLCVERHKNHPKVETWALAVSDKEGFADLFVKDATSTIVYDEAAKVGEVPKEDPVRVLTVTMDSLLAEWMYPEIDLLVVDVEGSEPAVLAGFTETRCLPKLAIIETHERSGHPFTDITGVNQKLVKCDAWFLEKHGYTKIFADECNTFYLKE